ncbi:MAG: hypothetical protein ACO3CR_01245 [Solirubrobacterales bacterium]
MDERESGFNGRTMAMAFLVQLLLVAVVSVVLALLLPKSFFEDWGWLIGPLAWLACAWGTSRILSLPTARTLIGAILVGIPSVIFVVLGLHWLGALVAAVLFGAWCAWRPAEPSPA